MDKQQFVIRRRDTGRFFCGFVASETIYGDESAAKRFSDREVAQAQALLLRMADERVQIKPVVVA